MNYRGNMSSLSEQSLVGKIKLMQEVLEKEISEANKKIVNIKRAVVETGELEKILAQHIEELVLLLKLKNQNS